MRRICDIPECGRVREGRGLCAKHYQRLMKHGDPLHEKPTWRETFWTHVEVTGSCWNWTGGLASGGYGTAAHGGKKAPAHRVGYELLVGPIPPGITLDHLCRNRTCVNPDHLEPCPHGVNLLRGFAPSSINARKTHCKHGHEFTPENTYVRPDGLGRGCRECIRINNTKRRAFLRERGAL